MVCLQLYVKLIESSPGAFAAESIYSRSINMQGISSSNRYETKDHIWKMCAWRDLMARIHDDNLKYVLSDKAIVALAAKFPKEPMEVYDVIAEADSSPDSSSINPLLSSPSPVVISHLNELCCLLQEMNANLNDKFISYLQKHLSPTGCCKHSLYNYAISCEFSLKGKSTLLSKQSGGKLAPPVGTKTSHELSVQNFLCKSPVYDNCRIYNSDGQLLCYCEKRRLQWYLRQDLAKLVETDPPAIMLLFQRKGHSEFEDNDFYTQIRKNLCVGCGEKNHYLRYWIIPSCYRSHFPEHLKRHRSHDIVLLCAYCHEIACSAAEKYKNQIANEYKIPLFVRKIVDRRENEVTDTTTKSVCEVEQEGVSPMQLRNAAMALLRHGLSMPLEKQTELMQIVREYFGGREISSQDLETALLVGMTPRERREAERKKGLHFKHSEGSAFRKITKSTCSDTTESGIGGVVQSHESSSTDVDVGGRNAGRSDLGGVLSEAYISPSDSNEQHYHTRAEAERVIAFTSDKLNGKGDQTDGPHQVSSKSLKKVSLLGHGPHGKQVVEHIWHTMGEDGIRQFCLRWRKVFVEAVNPRFLHTGWDVMHR